MVIKKFKLIFFVPVENAKKVKDAIFKSGAGKMGNYSHCSFETEGLGQFMPLSGSQPHIGTQKKVSIVKELKVELLCTENQIKSAIEALIEAHPYEEPAFEVYQLYSF